MSMRFEQDQNYWNELKKFENMGETERRSDSQFYTKDKEIIPLVSDGRIYNPIDENDSENYCNDISNNQSNKEEQYYENF